MWSLVYRELSCIVFVVRIKIKQIGIIDETVVFDCMTLSGRCYFVTFPEGTHPLDYSKVEIFAVVFLSFAHSF